ncbi:MAG: minor capsid protein [Clostridia bacterium]|nr:minor capsid protein [Clostridia bacterium]
MDNERYEAIIAEDADRAVRNAFKRKKRLVPTHIQLYPYQAERAYTRLLEGYTKKIRAEYKKAMPQILKAYKDEIHTDAAFNFTSLLGALLSVIRKNTSKIILGAALVGQLLKVGEQTQKTALTEWKKTINDTLKVNIYDDYYMGDFFQDNVSKWVEQNVSLIQGLTDDMATQMSELIDNAYSSGLKVTELQKQIQAKFDMDERRAKLISRDQIAKLNSQITQAYQRDAGITKYKWLTCRDERVRASHRALDGKIFSWDDPPEMWHEAKSGKVYEGRRCHPGEDYCCRCVAIPVFERDAVTLPIKDDKGNQK